MDLISYIDDGTRECLVMSHLCCPLQCRWCIVKRWHNLARQVKTVARRLDLISGPTLKCVLSTFVVRFFVLVLGREKNSLHLLNRIAGIAPFRVSVNYSISS